MLTPAAGPKARARRLTMLLTLVLVAGLVWGWPAPGAAAEEISQRGDNKGEIDQGGHDYQSGDTGAGSQITSIVNTGGETRVRASNRSSGTTATSGDVSGRSEVSAEAGPRITAGSAPRVNAGSNVERSIVQRGDNEVEVADTRSLSSGDAMSGSQVIGLVSSGLVTVDAANNTTDAEAVSGDVTADTDLAARAGPRLDAALFPSAFPTTTVSTVSSTAAINQELTQSQELSQENTTTVDRDPATPQNQSSITQTNTVTQTAVQALDVDQSVTTELTPTVDDAATLTATGRIEQDGDNTASLGPRIDASSGDALAGVQVIAAAGAGTKTFQLSNTTSDVTAHTGDVDADVALSATAGPRASSSALAPVFQFQIAGTQSATVSQTATQSQDVDQQNTAAVEQTASADATSVATNEATIEQFNETSQTGVQAAEITQSVAPVAAPVFAGTMTASASIDQQGDNTTELAGPIDVASGDAVAGAQVAAAVGPGDQTIQATNLATDIDARSGDASASASSAATAGPRARATGFAPEIVMTTVVSQTATSSQELSQLQEVSQSNTATITQTATATDSSTTSNKATVDQTNSNQQTAVQAAQIDQVASPIFAPVFQGTASADASITQQGDNDTSATILMTVASGDAVGGGQILAATGSGTQTIQASNQASDVTTQSGDASATQQAIGNAGPAADATGAAPRIEMTAETNQTATSEQTIDQTQETQQSNTATIAQTATATVSSTASNEATVDQTNSNQQTAVQAAQIDQVASPIFALVFQGTASADASITQQGDNDTSATIVMTVASGDAVGGGQILAATGSGTQTIQASNQASDVTTQSGDASATQQAIANAGPAADATGAAPRIEMTAETNQTATSEQTIDQTQETQQSNTATIAQTATATVSSTESNEATVDQTNSNQQTAVQAAQIDQNASPVVSPTFAFTGSAAGSIVQRGDNSGDISQTLDSATGDALAGAQVTGLVGAGTQTVVLDNRAQGATSQTGSSHADAVVGLFVGSFLTTIGDAAAAAVVG